MSRILYFILILASAVTLNAQPIKYSTANAHSHNNYEQPVPFWEAYNQQYGSIEADVFLSADSNDLWVAHNLRDLDVKKISIDSLYLRPLVTCIRKNKGYVYADHSRKLQLMVDIKTQAIPALKQLIKMISKYQELVNNRSLQIVISGSRPDPAQFADYPSFILFDGNAGVVYTEASLTKIVMISAPLTQYTHWNGEGPIPAEEEKNIQAVIKKVHDQKKTIRFWAAPDNINAWNTLMKLQVDYINTDKVKELATFLQNH